MITGITDLRKAVKRRQAYRSPAPKSKLAGRQVVLTQHARTRVGRRILPAGSIGYLRFVDKRGRLIIDFGRVLVVVPADSPLIKVLGEAA